MEMNWIAILVAAVIPTAVGALWYGPLFEGKWLDSIGKDKEWTTQGNMPVIFGVSFIMALILSFAIKATIELTHGAQFDIDGAGSFHTFKHGMLHGAMLMILFVMPPFVANNLFERKGLTNLWIHVGYWVVTGALMGGVLDAWV